MGYAGKLKEKFKARKLRSKGWSVKSIEKELGVARSSVSIWVRDIKLTKKQLEVLYLNKKTGQLRGSIIAAMNKQKKRKETVEKLKKQGVREIGKLTRRDRFIAGIAMYFAEGAKTDQGLSFSNSDPIAISFMMKWLREFCHIPEEKFRGRIYLHDNLNEKRAKKFWSGLISIPLEQFTKSYIVKNDSNRFRKTKNQHGVFSIVISDVNMLRRIMGWISGVLDNKN